MPQDRMEGDDKSPQVGGLGFTNLPDISESLARAQKTLGKVRVVHGPNEKYFDNLSGKTVGSVRKSLRDAFNIPGDATALVGGKEVGDDFVLASGQNLEFVKEAGVKGKRLRLPIIHAH